MGVKQTKPMVDVHTVQQRLGRGELLYLKNLFLFLAQHTNNHNTQQQHQTNQTNSNTHSNHTPSASSSSSSSSHSLPSSSPNLNSSLSSSALATSSNLELMSLRLSKSACITYLLGPSLPSGISYGLLERFYHIFAYQGYNSMIDYSEFLVMMYTLWYSQTHEELMTRFLFTLFDVGGNGKIGKKEYRKVATVLLEEYSNNSSSSGDQRAGGGGGGGSSTSNASGAGSGSGGGESRDYLGTLFDLYFHLALYHYDRDHDKFLSLNEFSSFAEEDLLLSSFLTVGRKDSRQSKQRVQQLIGARGEQFVQADNNTNSALGTSRSTSKRPSSLPAAAAHPPLPLPHLASSALTRNFIGDEEVEDTSGAIWRQQRRSTIKAHLNANKGQATSTQ